MMNLTNDQAGEAKPVGEESVVLAGWPRRVVPLATLVLIGGVGWWSLATLERTKRAELANALETTLAANVTALTLWFDDQRAMANVLASDPQVRAAAAELAARRGASGEDTPVADLLASPGAGRLRLVLAPALREGRYAGFAVVDRTGRTVAASDDSVGGRALAERAAAVGRALAGQTGVARPYPAEVALPGADGAMQPAGTPTMLVAAPLRTDGGSVVGALVLRVRPEAGFTQILQVARFGESGETYAVDDRGLMLSQSRFDD